MRDTFLSFLTLSLMLVFSPAQGASNFGNCIHNGKIRLFYDSEQRYETASYCTNSDKTSLLTEKCVTLNCFSKLPRLDLKMKDLYSAAGKPGFELCRKLNGRGQIVEFLVDGKWYKLDRCVFDQESWYVDTGFLLGNYLKNK